MTISGTPNSPRSNGIQGVEATKAATPAQETSSAKRGNSRVEVSQSAKQMAELSKLVRGAPDTRADLVDNIKQRVESGSYEVDLDGLAERLSNVI